MKFGIFINFNGNCREAAEFYAKTFKSEVKNLMTYAEAPADSNNPLDPKDKDLIMYAEVQVGDMNVMMMDMTSNMPANVGNNITLATVVDSDEEVKRLFDELKDSGQVYMEMQKTFYAEMFALVQDKYGIIWNIMRNS